MSMSYEPSFLWGIAVHGENFNKFVSSLGYGYGDDDDVDVADVLDAELSGIMMYALLYPDEDVVSSDLDFELSDRILILGLDKQPELTEGPAYPNPEAAIAEIKEKVGKYLPDDFDYMNCLGCYAYAIYG